MKMFIKADNYAVKFTLVVTIIADVALIVFGIMDNTSGLSLAIASGLTIIMLLLWILGRTEGLEIENDNLCYKGLRKKYYGLKQIAGLHIVKDQIYIGKLSSIDIKIKGEYKYKIIYLKDTDFEYNDFYGVNDFYTHYRKHILFYTVYDEEAIQYFKDKGIRVTGKIQ